MKNVNNMSSLSTTINEFNRTSATQSSDPTPSLAFLALVALVAVLPGHAQRTYSMPTYRAPVQQNHPAASDTTSAPQYHAPAQSAPQTRTQSTPQPQTQTSSAPRVQVLQQKEQAHQQKEAQKQQQKEQKVQANQQKEQESSVRAERTREAAEGSGPSTAERRGSPGKGIAEEADSKEGYQFSVRFVFQGYRTVLVIQRAGGQCGVREKLIGSCCTDGAQVARYNPAAQLRTLQHERNQR